MNPMKPKEVLTLTVNTSRTPERDNCKCNRRRTLNQQFRLYVCCEKPKGASVNTTDLLQAMQEVEKRAERVSEDHVIATYVDDAPLIGALGSRDNGVIFGRRGTGKTHALKYLAETERNKGNFVAFIDMEKDTGSTEGRYVDQSISVPERATRLLVDVLSIIHTQLLEDAFNGRVNAQIELLDSALDHFSEVIVSAEEELEVTQNRSDQVQDNLQIGWKTGSLGNSSTSSDGEQVRTRVSGRRRHRIHFGALGRILRQIFEKHESKRCWIILDEWSAVPLDLQPYLGQMLRSLFFAIPTVTVRIGAIPHRTEWRISGERGDYVGIEIGSEFFPLLDLDEFVVFPARSREEQTSRSVAFFKKLLFRHLTQALANENLEPLQSVEQMMKLLFTQQTSLQEAIRAAEGVPRDALNIISRASLRSNGSRVSTVHVRAAAVQLYQTTKEAQLNSVIPARKLLEVILKDVLGTRKARAFLLLPEHSSNSLIQQLIDDRILHVIKRGYSGKDEPGVRFDVIQIDYGCYARYLGTVSAPQNLLGDDSISDDDVMAVFYDDEMSVPEDDYRAIRRAVLDLPAALAQISND